MLSAITRQYFLASRSEVLALSGLIHLTAPKKEHFLLPFVTPEGREMFIVFAGPDVFRPYAWWITERGDLDDIFRSWFLRQHYRAIDMLALQPSQDGELVSLPDLTPEQVQARIPQLVVNTTLTTTWLQRFRV